MKICQDILSGLALDHSFSNDLTHLMCQRRARFPNIFGLTHGASKVFRYFAYLFINLCFINGFRQASNWEGETQQDDYGE
jgi:hypothetical protein